MTKKEKEYVSAMKQVDYRSLNIEIISAYQLGKSKTVPIMTRLRMSPQIHISEQPHKLIKTDVLLIEVGAKSLVVISKLDKHIFPVHLLPSADGGATITCFKREDIAYTLTFNEYATIAKIKWSPDKTLNLWKNPYALYAQTEFDKDYRKEWIGGELVYEGNNYGDTSDFLIIGVLIGQ